jgi:hypothetical protein
VFENREEVKGSGGDFVIRSFMICAPYQILLFRQSNQDGCSTWNIQESG